MTVKLDQIDKKILSLLQQDAALTIKEIATYLSRSKSNINDRILRLQNDGIISHYMAVINKKEVQDHCTFFTHIQLIRQTNQISENFIKVISNFQEVITCHQVTGDVDFILKIQVKDISTYYTLLIQTISKIYCVGGIHTYMALSEDKDETTLTTQLLTTFLFLTLSEVL